MTYKVYVVKCDLGKFWVGFTNRELDVHLERIIEGKSRLFSREYVPWDIFLICETDLFESAEILNVSVYQVLSRVMGSGNVHMDSSRYKKICHSDIKNNINNLFLNEGMFSISLIKQSENELITDLNNGFIVYSLLCTRGARYIGMTTNLTETLESHENGTKCWFTKTYKPIKIEKQKYYDKEIDAKICQIDILDELKYEYGNNAKIYTEFIDLKPDSRVVWEDILSPVTAELFENTPNEPNTSYWVYVLICEDSKYYVGLTNDLRSRFKEHVSGLNGANFTFQYPPRAVFHIEGHKNRNSAERAERSWTLDIKKLKGKENVFGYWSKILDNTYYAHERLEKWIIKNERAYDIKFY